MSNSPRRVVGICFDHMHIGDLLGKAQASDVYEVVGVYDTQPERMAEVCDDLEILPQLQYTDWQQLLDATRPDLAIVCSPTAQHADWAERLAQRGIHILLEKPFAVSAEDAQRCIDAAENYGVQLAINWPLAWYPPHRTSRRMIAEGLIGDVIEVHYYDGNRGPQYHVHAKKEVENPVNVEDTWWFNPDAGGGSMLDYLGYGVTLATWMRDGELPTEVSAVTHVPTQYRVDMQSVVVAKYASGLSCFQTRWGTFTDPWINQPQPFCGFVVVGTEGTIMSRDYADTVMIQTRANPEATAIPVDEFTKNDIFTYLHDSLDQGHQVDGPCGPEISLGAQRIADAAVASVKEGRPVRL
ncbi:Gfo/Idh/MocA family oxidoreductase [Pseudomaricurvus alkylphenolicus]|jgi:glucose-fructose oxidoreductase|uniref:Gfo/Idh/MocA family protein n=1 Tax=Pseudomaricurvus alkylphenolicus TaxID=1306991 RepID=UPI00142429A2|nr:Gfo/Idh/MocA family oxidoreductase [Pseudomaricurvus alkylphenolicus]NIB38229.1 Gfo/Idh/MocA family oxidoreductase [Pseudomaricurvus alkylphenolicus]